MPEDVSEMRADWDRVDGQGYILDRNRKRRHAAASRLNLQFYLWQDTLGFNIQPTVAAALPRAAAIAEVASGTGLWLGAVSRQRPEARCDGLDLNLGTAPPAAWLPANAQLRRWDVLGAVPDDMAGGYDFVHTRLLLFVVEAGDPRPIARNLWRLLKPGGYVQWDEAALEHTRVDKTDPGLATPALDQLAAWLRARRHNWGTQLARFLGEEGFQDATIESFGDRPDLARAVSGANLLGVEEVAECMATLGESETAAKYFRLIEEAHEESIAGAALCVPRVVCTARKPF
ncbi:hypothetical protein GGS23DRAFT_318066 [Durotheca rogersii]|uniref:uncharacterized protein n=1 Tax=Durotheca rogersii TaxID=419775 RepID=UPI00221F5056|nr:uncharacterized protein GGS23DRAFT_318066 [Durotheca rogersii]KAI5859445.1 hypothetical protein GGS23DRAFT_318066 [Durotheca rogersii]